MRAAGRRQAALYRQCLESNAVGRGRHRASASRVIRNTVAAPSARTPGNPRRTDVAPGTRGVRSPGSCHRTPRVAHLPRSACPALAHHAQATSHIATETAAAPLMLPAFRRAFDFQQNMPENLHTAAQFDVLHPIERKQRALLPRLLCPKGCYALHIMKFYEVQGGTYQAIALIMPPCMCHTEFLPIWHVGKK